MNLFVFHDRHSAIGADLNIPNTVIPVARLIIVLALGYSCGTTTEPSAQLLKPFLDIRIDEGANFAVASLSQVVADASGSEGSGPTYRIDFGDGYVAHTPTATHVYQDQTLRDRSTSFPGYGYVPFTITLTITDRHGHQAQKLETVKAWSPEGIWGGSIRFPSKREAEIRFLRVQQRGLQLSGTFSYNDGTPHTVTYEGMLVSPRGMRLKLDSGGVLEGTSPDGFGLNNYSLTVTERGDDADGARVIFYPYDT